MLECTVVYKAICGIYSNHICMYVYRTIKNERFKNPNIEVCGYWEKKTKFLKEIHTKRLEKHIHNSYSRSGSTYNITCWPLKN